MRFDVACNYPLSTCRNNCLQLLDFFIKLTISESMDIQFQFVYQKEIEYWVKQYHEVCCACLVIPRH